MTREDFIKKLLWFGFAQNDEEFLWRRTKKNTKMYVRVELVGEYSASVTTSNECGDNYMVFKNVTSYDKAIELIHSFFSDYSDKEVKPELISIAEKTYKQYKNLETVSTKEGDYQIMHNKHMVATLVVREDGTLLIEYSSGIHRQSIRLHVFTLQELERAYEYISKAEELRDALITHLAVSPVKAVENPGDPMSMGAYFETKQEAPKETKELTPDEIDDFLPEEAGIKERKKAVKELRGLFEQLYGILGV